MLQYDQPVYRPPSEAQSFIVQVVLGCPHNRCAFCDMYRTKKFRVRDQADILADLEHVAREYGPDIKSIFLADGNAIVVPTPRLAEICARAHACFPNLERVTCYGAARFAIHKSLADLQTLRAAGLNRLHMGLESGDPDTLTRIEKGADRDTILTAARRVLAAGIELSLYVMVGVAGTERWREHALASATAINEIVPTTVRLRTFVPRPGTPLYDQWRAGGLTLPDPYQALRETRRLVEHIDAWTELVSDHLSNFLDVSGKLPRDRDALLVRLDNALTWPRHRFRPDTEHLVHLGL